MSFFTSVAKHFITFFFYIILTRFQTPTESFNFLTVFKNLFLLFFDCLFTLFKVS